MLAHVVRTLTSLAATAVLCSCGAVATEAFEPLVGATPLDVSLQTSSGEASPGLPRLEAVGLTGEVQVVWDVESGPCLIATATAGQAGSVIEIQIHRSGNPLANCVPALVVYHHVARAKTLAPGRYEIRLVDAPLGMPEHEVGRRSVLVTAE